MYNYVDRYVLVGNHRDAWILGSIDPSSGTASMLEMARAFGKMKTDHGKSFTVSIIIDRFCSFSHQVDFYRLATST